MADDVAMAAFPPCVVIACSNGTKEVERKVCVCGGGAYRRDRNKSMGRRGHQEESWRLLCTSAVQSMQYAC